MIRTSGKYRLAGTWRQVLWLPLLVAAAISVVVASELGVTTQVLEKVSGRYGSEARARLVAWENLVKAYRDASESEKLHAVNDFFNDNILFVDDIQHWGVEDYWATPIEFLATGAGDCEDYSIAKFFTLRALGVSESKLRITYVKARLSYGVQAHMVLTYFTRPSAIPLVLDNLNSLISPATDRRDLTPVYNFNAGGLYLASASGSGQRVGGASRLSMWSDLQQRMRAGAWGG